MKRTSIRQFLQFQCIVVLSLFWCLWTHAQNLSQEKITPEELTTLWQSKINQNPVAKAHHDVNLMMEQIFEDHIREKGRDKALVIFHQRGFLAQGYSDFEVLSKTMKNQMEELVEKARGGSLVIVAKNSNQGVAALLKEAQEASFLQRLTNQYQVTIKTVGIGPVDISRLSSTEEASGAGVMNTQLDHTTLLVRPDETKEFKITDIKRSQQKSVSESVRANMAALFLSDQKQLSNFQLIDITREGGEVTLQETTELLLELYKMIQTEAYQYNDSPSALADVKELSKRVHIVLETGYEPGISTSEKINDDGRRAATDLALMLEKVARRGYFSDLIKDVNISLRQAGESLKISDLDQKVTANVLSEFRRQFNRSDKGAALEQGFQELAELAQTNQRESIEAKLKTPSRSEREKLAREILRLQNSEKLSDLEQNNLAGLRDKLDQMQSSRRFTAYALRGYPFVNSIHSAALRERGLDRDMQLIFHRLETRAQASSNPLTAAKSKAEVEFALAGQCRPLF